MQAKLLITAAKALALAILLCTLAPASSVRAQDDLDVSVFYDELEPHGRWFTHPRYGHVWSPDVDDDWRPYSRGHWIYTDDHGWYWEAEESWGWGPFHYGRWIMDDEFGWVWIPGTEWGPAWVAWRYSDEYVGWAPLPPEAEWYEDRGLTFSASYYDAPQFAPLWIFVEPRYLVLPGLHRYALPRSRNVFALGRTRWHTDYRFVNRRIFNTGFDVRRLERITRRPLVRVRLVTSDSPRSRGFRGNDRATLHTYRPRLMAKANPPRPPRLVEPPRRGEPRRQDGGGRPVVRPGFTPQDDDNIQRKGFRGPDDDRRKDFVRTPKDDDDNRRQRDSRPPDAGQRKDAVRTPKDDDDNRRQKDFRPPDADQRKDVVRTPKDDDDNRRQRDLRPPDAGQRKDVVRTRKDDDDNRRQRDSRPPDAGQRKDSSPPPRQRTEGGAPPPQQFKQQGGGAPPQQRGEGRRPDDAGRKGKQPPESEQKDGTVPR